jgi:quercetin dioxygenase-like cupin family protein
VSRRDALKVTNERTSMRRVVTASDENGRSFLVSDGTPPILFHFRDQTDPHSVAAVRVTELPGDLMPGAGVLGELWAADATAAPDGTVDSTIGLEGWAVDVPPGASRFRTSLFSPGRQTAMHRTNTLDYDFVLSGSVTLILGDSSETELMPGDAVVLPATDHAWRAGPDGCRLGVVMIGLPTG